MCGIFGAVGSYSVHDLRMLAVLNEVRGTDSLGFYNGAVFRTLRKARDTLTDIEPLVVRPSRYVMGHTRKATVGSVSLNNAHPLIEGDIVGIHNGTIFNWKEILDFYDETRDVDSSVIFYGINMHGVEWLEEINGRYAIAWMDRKDPKFMNLACYNKPLAISIQPHVVWFSSDIEDLKRLGLPEATEVPSGTALQIDTETLRVDSLKIAPVYQSYNFYIEEYRNKKKNEHREKKENAQADDSAVTRGYGAGMFKPESSCQTGLKLLTPAREDTDPLIYDPDLPPYC